MGPFFFLLDVDGFILLVFTFGEGRWLYDGISFEDHNTHDNLLTVVGCIGNMIYYSSWDMV
jgi:hypothetical protein